MILSADNLRDYMIEQVDEGACSRDFANELLDHFGIAPITRTFDFKVEYKDVDIMNGIIEAVDLASANAAVEELIDDSNLIVTTRIGFKKVADPDSVDVTWYARDEDMGEESIYSYECSIEIWEIE